MRVVVSIPDKRNALQYYAFLIIFTSVLIALFVLFRRYTWTSARDPIVGLTVVSFVSLAAVWVGYGRLSRSFSILNRLTVSTFLFYLFTVYPTADPSLSPELLRLVEQYDMYRAIGIASAVLALVLPSVSLITYFCAYTVRMFAPKLYGLDAMGSTDYYTVAELGSLLVFGAILYTVVDRVILRPRQLFQDEGRATINPIDYVVFVVIALHFGNYFCSGLAKVLLNGGPMSWLLHSNAPANSAGLLDYGRASFAMLLGDWTGQFYSLVERGNLLVNAIVLFSQLAAVVAILRVRWVFFLTLFYDLFHFLVFFFTGIFFWKWVVFNIGIVLALRSFRYKQIHAALGAVGMVLVVAGTNFFYIFWGGWYNTSAFHMERIYAVAADGQRYQVPSNYFGGASLSFAQHRIVPQMPGHFGVSGNGNTSDMSTLLAANDCALGVDREQAATEGINEAPIAEKIRRHHRYILSAVDGDGRVNYDLYPHHIWSNPFGFQEFQRLDKRVIEKYAVVVESVCYERVGSDYLRQVLLTSGFDIGVADLRVLSLANRS
jgi:hypothetical protein